VISCRGASRRPTCAAQGRSDFAYLGHAFLYIMAKVAETAPSLPYHEPDIITILIQSSFLLLLNLVNTILDRLVYCGLLGQVLVGIAWGTPGAKWLSIEAEEVIVQLGYLGLILLVYEGMQ
jgi:hypothetical protein